MNNIEILVNKSEALLSKIDTSYFRSILNEIDWSSKLIGIKGARGVGKTTTILQKLKILRLPPREAIYISLDDLYFEKVDLVTFAQDFERSGGKFLFIDEVHKYEGWSKHIKNIYDFQSLHVVFTGSSIIEISELEVDLSRRAVMYSMPGLSFREFLAISEGIELPLVSLEKLTDCNPRALRELFDPEFRPLAYFQDYLEYGYFPFFNEDIAGFAIKINQVIRLIVEYDMAELKSFDIRNAKKMIHLFSLISQNVPYKPNISKLAQKTNISRTSVYSYLHFLERAQLVKMLHHDGISLSTLAKPEKIYLENTNYMHALSDGQPDKGNIRETFFLNQVAHLHQVGLPKKGDFIADNRFTFEIGGRTKQFKQLEGIDNGYLVKDDLDYSVNSKVIPLWMFGMMY